MKNIRVNLGLVFLLLGMHFSSANAEGTSKKIIKWVDEKGVTHYGDVQPTEYNNKNSVLNSRGMLIQNHDVKTQTPVDTPEQQEQQRKDKALLASYTTQEEIDLALERHLQMDEITTQGLLVRKTSVQKQLTANKKTADGFVTRKKEVPADLTQDIKSNEAEIVHIDAQIKQQRESSEASKQRFAADKQRFIELKSTAAK